MVVTAVGGVAPHTYQWRQVSGGCRHGLERAAGRLP
ncbi:hypothetical protein RAM_19930 [Amycolatopsis mediterranei S699]|uniref:Uncharacterized protein n=1 Tax=Amycolatopsis mediterranei (strain S699) TaxID=713604 RepID=A0A9R0NXK3_AMYMS|nr:hypothetical protein RAM_19930 [Amycolatopsis mediterranei S699]